MRGGHTMGHGIDFPFSKNYFKFQMFLSKFQKLMSICNFIIENHEYQGQFENLQVLTPWLQKTMTFRVDPTC
jgi:hypothetical protein